MKNIEQSLHQRSNSSCELCGGKTGLQIYEVPPHQNGPDTCVLICGTCMDLIRDPTKQNPHHWRCLTQTIWSDVPAVQVTAWRILNGLREGWPQELLEQLYLDDKTLAWAKQYADEQPSAVKEIAVHRDCNGAPLGTEDNVVLIKDLDVRGAGFTAKRGTTVRGITLVENNVTQIEGRINGQRIVILTQFVRKA